MAAQLLCRRDDGIGWITIDNQAHRNALTEALQIALADRITDLDHDPAIRVIVLTGAGTEAFVAGADISEFERSLHDPVAAQHYRAVGDKMLAALHQSSTPLIAAIQGVCIGAGMALAGECDLRYAVDDARFGIPASKLGIGYPVDATRRLVELVGPGLASEMFLAGQLYDAARLHAAGWLQGTVPRADFTTSVTRLASSVAQAAPLALRAARLSIRSDSQAARDAVDACFASADLVEGWRAFTAKRRPVFQGK